MASGKDLWRVVSLLKAAGFRLPHAMLQFRAAVQHLLQTGPGACSSNVLSTGQAPVPSAQLLSPKRPAIRHPLSSPGTSSVVGCGTIWVLIAALFMALVFVTCVILAVAPALLSFHASHQVLNWQCSFYIISPYIEYILCQGISTTPAVTQAMLQIIYVLCPKAMVWHGSGVAGRHLPPVNGLTSLCRTSPGARPRVSSMAMACEHSSDEGPGAMSKWSRACHNLAVQVVSCAQHVLFMIAWQFTAFVCYGGAVMAELAIFFSWVKVGRPTAVSASPLPHEQHQLPGQQQQQHDIALLQDARANARCISAMTALLNNMLMFLIAVFLLFIPLAAGGTAWSFVVGLRASGVAFTALSGAATLSRFLCSCCLSNRQGLRSCSTWVFFLCVNLYLLGTVCLQIYCFLWAFSRYGSNGLQVYGFLSEAFHLSMLLLNPDNEAKMMLSAGWTTNKVLLVGCVLVTGGTGICLDWPALLAAFGLAERSSTLVRQHMWCMRVLFSPANRVLLLLRLVGQGMFLLSMNCIGGKPPCQSAPSVAGQHMYAPLAKSISEMPSMTPSADSASQRSRNNKDLATTTATATTAMDMFLVGCQQCSLPLQLGSAHTIEPDSGAMWLIAGVMASVAVGAYIATYLVFVYRCAGPSSVIGASSVGQISNNSSGLAVNGTATTSNQTNRVVAQPSGSQRQRSRNWLQFVVVLL